MLYAKTTQVPNVLFDTYLPLLSEVELKVLFIIIRQTWGWCDLRTGRRKERDYITISRFAKATGFSRRAVSKALTLLFSKGLILITDYSGNTLSEGEKRKGKKLFYALSRYVHAFATGKAPVCTGVVHTGAYNKTNSIQTNTTQKSSEKFKHIGKFLLP